ncbi:hypothetical protein D3C75_1300290 [compost metagenome]
MFDKRAAELSAHPRRFDPTERQRRIEEGVHVDPQGTYFNPRDHAHRLAEIVSPQASGQAIRRIVDHGDHLLFILIGQESAYRAKGLLTH